jgi:hypothetical protein
MCCLLYPVSEAVAENIRVGPVRIHPFVSGSVGFTDNVFLTETNEESDVFFLLSPGIRLIVPSERFALNVDYTFDYYNYSKFSESDRTIHNATGTLDLNPWRSLDIRIKDTFTRGQDLPRFEGDRAAPFIWNSPGIDVGYSFTSRLALGAGYEYASKRYDRSIDRIDDNQENAFSGRLYYKVLPKTSLVLDYWYRTRDYDERSTDDSDSNRLEGGVTWDFGAKSTGTVRVGYMATDYDGLGRSDSALSYFIGLTHRLRPKTVLILEGAREILDTSSADRNLVFSNDYVSTQIAGTLTHRYRKLTGKLRLGYIRDDYLHDDISAGKKRKDDLFTAEFGLDHALRKWLRLGASYRYTRLNSNFKTEEYTENAFLFYLSLIL